MKRIISLLLLTFMILSLASCAKISDLGDGDNKKDPQKNEEDVHAGKEVEDESSVNFLVLGHDRAASLTDVMMLVNFDTKAGNMTITQIPRDTYIEVEGESYYKINGLYNHCIGEARAEGSSDAKLDGCIKTADYLEKALGIRIHYSAVMDLDGFRSIVDSIGGVYMYVPYSMLYSDPTQNLYISLLEGYQTLDGKKAEQFVRFRSGYIMADIARGDAQKMFMTAFIEAAKKNVSVSSLTGVAEAILDSVKTDMSLADIMEIGKTFLSVDLSNITMLTLPGEGCTSASGASFYVLNKECLVDILNESYNVFSEKISLEDFDNEGIFVNESDSNMLKIYNKSADELNFKKHNAQDVSENDIPIMLK